MSTRSIEKVRVRATMPTNEGRFFWRMWHQEVTIDNDGNEQTVHLKGKSREEIEALKNAIEQVVITHEVWDDLRDSSNRHETATILRTQAQKDNRRANTLLFEHNIRLKGFILPVLLIGREK